MDRFENMDTFIRVVEAGSISGAADRMGVAKSAVSRRLKELETHLGVELFHRTTRQMTLTDTGRSFYHQAVRILDDVLEKEFESLDEDQAQWISLFRLFGKNALENMLQTVKLLLSSSQMRSEQHKSHLVF